MKSLDRQPILMDEERAGAMWLGKLAAGTHSAGTKGAEIALIEKIAMELSVAMEGLSAVAIRAQQMDVDPGLVQAFRRIRKSTETAMNAIGDIVDFSKMSGGVVLHKRDFALRAALADLVSRLIPDAEEHRCRLRIKVEQDVADSLEGDDERLQLVLKNLLDTAFMLMPGSEATLQITPEYVTESGIQLSFSVTATSAAQSVAKANADSGMGVAVAKFMVAAMGGKLAVAARAAGDALYSFTLEFPVRPPPPPPRRATYVSLVGLPVLVVSGDPDQRLALSNRLRGWRMVPLEADNAPMALALLERMQQEGAPIPVVILSNELPVQDGFLLAFRIKNHARFTRRPRSSRGIRCASSARAPRCCWWMRSATRRSSPPTSWASTTAAWCWRRTSLKRSPRSTRTSMISSSWTRRSRASRATTRRSCCADASRAIPTWCGSSPPRSTIHPLSTPRRRRSASTTRSPSLSARRRSPSSSASARRPKPDNPGRTNTQGEVPCCRSFSS